MQFFKKIIVSILTCESRIILRKYRPFIVAVTGSVGKTSTKDAIYSVLKDSSKYVRKSEKSINSEIGLPLTILGVPNAWKSIGGWMRNIGAGLKLIFGRNEYPDTLILEVGADHPNDIKKVVKWLRPHIAVITRVSKVPVHVEFFSSPEQVFEEKASLVRGVRKGGTAVLYADDERMLGLKDELIGRKRTVKTFGMSEQSDVRAVDYKLSAEVSGFEFGIKTTDGSSHTVHIKGVIGETYMYPLLAAAAVGLARGLDMQRIIHGLNGYEAPRGRMNLIRGKNGTMIIDDTYNSSPDAVEAALGTLKAIPAANGGRKVAVLGDMMELGKYSVEQHKEVGKKVVEKVDVLVTVGQRAKAIAEEAKVGGFNSANIHMYETAVEAGHELVGVIQPGDVVLIKGSQSVRLEKVVKALMGEPEKAKALLVRQEEEWLNK